MSLLRLAGVWALLAVLMIGNGMFRELVLRPSFGPTNAQVLSVVTGIVIILAVTRFLLRPLAGLPNRELIRASFVLVTLTVAFEFLFGRYVEGESWSELAGNYAIWRGRLWPIVLLVIAIIPFLWGRWLPAKTTYAPQ